MKITAKGHGFTPDEIVEMATEMICALDFALNVANEKVEQLKEENENLQCEIDNLKDQIEKLERLVFGEIEHNYRASRAEETEE